MRRNRWRRPALIVVACLAAPATARASPLAFDFSFTSFLGAVTGEIRGLDDNTHSAAESVLVKSIAGITAPFTLPYDTRVDNVFDFGNEFWVAGGMITAATYHAENDAYTLDLESPGFYSELVNKAQDTSVIGRIEYTPAADPPPLATPEPSSLSVLLAFLLIAMSLLTIRCNRKEQ